MAKKPKIRTKRSELISSGSTLLNLLVSGHPNGCYEPGKYYFFVGDSMSGKTWFSMTMLAEAVSKRHYDDYTLIYDDIERGVNMDVPYYFGQDVEDRIEEPPRGISDSVEAFYFNINDALDNGPCIYILDSMDSLTSIADQEQFEKEAKAHEEGKDVSGSYGTGKAKANSKNLPLVVEKLAETGSILIIISQTRDNIGFAAQFNPKTRSGGKALRFYAHVEIWTSVVKTLTKTVRGKKREIGANTKCKIAKNRCTGQRGDVEVPFMHTYGIDDVASLITYLLDEKTWTKSSQTINAKGLDFKGTEAKLIEHIEAEKLEDVVADIANDTWKDIQEQSKTVRKRRYE